MDQILGRFDLIIKKHRVLGWTGNVKHSMKWTFFVYFRKSSGKFQKKFRNLILY